MQLISEWMGFTLTRIVLLFTVEWIDTTVNVIQQTFATFPMCTEDVSI